MLRKITRVRERVRKRVRKRVRVRVSKCAALFRGETTPDAREKKETGKSALNGRNVWELRSPAFCDTMVPSKKRFVFDANNSE